MWSLRWSEKPEERDRNPSSPQKKGKISQLVERRPEEPSVGGSNPSLSTKRTRSLIGKALRF